MEKDKLTVTEVSHGPKITSLWHIKGFKEDFNYKLIKKSGKCLVRPGYLVGSDLPVELSFWFEENEYDAEDDGGNERVSVGSSSSLYKINTWIDLYVTVLSTHRQFMFSVDVDILDDSYCVKSSPVQDQLFSIESDFDAQAELLKSKFLLVSQKEYNRYKGAKSHKTILRPSDLLVKFSVSLVYFINCTEGGVDPPLESKVNVVNDLKKIWISDEKDKFSDLKIETKDNKNVHAHKFILAARSSKLKEMILKDGSSGTIKLKDVNEKSLNILLTWIYSGELDLHEHSNSVVQEIIDAAVKLEMNDLLKFLDKKIVSICTVDNMFELFKMAKKNSMRIATLDTSNFIKMNIGKLVLEDLP